MTSCVSERSTISLLYVISVSVSTPRYLFLCVSPTKSGPYSNLKGRKKRTSSDLRDFVISRVTEIRCRKYGHFQPRGLI